MKRYQTHYDSYPAFSLEQLRTDFDEIVTPPRVSHWIIITQANEAMGLLTDYQGSPNSYEAFIENARRRDPLVAIIITDGVRFSLEEARRNVSGFVKQMQDKRLAYISEINVALIDYTHANRLYRSATGYDI